MQGPEAKGKVTVIKETASLEIQSVNTRSLNQAALAAYAHDGQEEIVAKYASDALLDHVAQFESVSEREFVFRCFWVPFEIIAFCENAFRSATDQPWNNPQHGLVFAHSRMLREMCAWGHDPRRGWWERGTAAEASRWWMQRYDAHLTAILAAHCYWIKRKCPNCFHELQDLAVAARYGFMQRVNARGVPNKCMAEVLPRMKERERSGSRESEFFHKTALDRAEPRWDHPGIDLWLIEVWPLVQQHDWTYREVYELALDKFGEDETYANARVLNRCEALRELCETLKLHLSELARERRGRPRRRPPGPSLPDYGKRVCEQLTKFDTLPDPAMEARRPQAHQLVAELAVNLDPCSRYLCGTSKEGCDFAVPRLKMGEKKTNIAPPFFEYCAA